jgi:hypothetical protein
VKKMGSETAASEPVMPTRSMNEPGLRAEKVPTVTPPMSQRMAAPTVRLMLTGAARSSRVPTSSFWRNE